MKSGSVPLTATSSAAQPVPWETSSRNLLRDSRLRRMTDRSGEHARLSAQELEVWHAVKKIGDGVFALVASDMERLAGVSGADFGVLSRLVDLGEGTLAQAELGVSMDWHRSRLSHQLTRMEARNLIKRETTQGKRAVAVHVTDEGERLLRLARPIHASSVRRNVIARLSGSEQQALLNIAKRLASSD